MSGLRQERKKTASDSGSRIIPLLDMVVINGAIACCYYVTIGTVKNLNFRDQRDWIGFKIYDSRSNSIHKNRSNFSRTVWVNLDKWNFQPFFFSYNIRTSKLEIAQKIKNIIVISMVAISFKKLQPKNDLTKNYNNLIFLKQPNVLTYISTT